VDQSSRIGGLSAKLCKTDSGRPVASVRFSAGSLPDAQRASGWNGPGVAIKTRSYPRPIDLHTTAESCPCNQTGQRLSHIRLSRICVPRNSFHE
jgi:hypothetical protein